MSLQKILKACAFAVAIALGAGSAQAQTVTLKLSHFVPPQHAFHKWVTAWAEKIEKESNGQLKFEIYPNGQLVGPPNRQLDAARNGIVDIAWVLHGVTPGRYPMTELANLPFTFPGGTPNLPEMAKRLTELAPKYLAAEHTGLHILFLNQAPPVLLFSKEPIKTLADYKGKKSATPRSPTNSCWKRSAPRRCSFRPRTRRTRFPKASSRAPCSPLKRASPTILPRR